MSPNQPTSWPSATTPAARTRHAFPGMDKLGSWSGLKSKSRILELIAELIDEGYLARVESGTRVVVPSFRCTPRSRAALSTVRFCRCRKGPTSPDPSSAPVSKGSDQSDATPPKGSDKGSDKGSGPIGPLPYLHISHREAAPEVITPCFLVSERERQD